MVADFLVILAPVRACTIYSVALRALTSIIQSYLALSHYFVQSLPTQDAAPPLGPTHPWYLSKRVARQRMRCVQNMHNFSLLSLFHLNRSFAHAMQRMLHRCRCRDTIITATVLLEISCCEVGVPTSD